jgi:salicylate hydroxylase
MAMEDAVCLADMVARHPGEVETALERYRRQRLLRTARVQLQSRAIGEHIYHPAGANALLRNATLHAMSPADIYDNLAWLYGDSGLSDDPVTAAGAAVSARPSPT